MWRGIATWSQEAISCSCGGEATCVGVEMPDMWDGCQEELQTGYRTRSRERNMIQSTGMGGVGRVKIRLSHWVWNIELQDLQVALLVFSLAVAQHSLTMPPLLPFGMVIHSSCHCMLEVSVLLFDFDFTGAHNYQTELDSEKTLDFGNLNIIEKGYVEFWIWTEHTLHDDMATSLWGQRSGMCGLDENGPRRLNT